MGLQHQCISSKGVSNVFCHTYLSDAYWLVLIVWQIIECPREKVLGGDLSGPCSFEAHLGKHTSNELEVR